MRRVAPAVVLAAALLLAAAGQAGAKVRWFHSPGGGVQCQVSAKDVIGTLAYCQTVEPARSVSLRRDGSTDVCRGIRCIGDPPQDATTLRRGKSVRVGPFRCTSRRRGIRCEVIASGRGFLLGERRLKRF